MMPIKIKEKIYEIFFLFSIVFIGLTLFVSNEFLTRRIEIVYLDCPSEVTIGETFQVRVGIKNLGSRTSVIVSAHMNAPPTYMMGEYDRLQVLLEGGETSSYTFEFKPMFAGATTIQVTVEVLSPGGMHYASETVKIKVKTTR